MIKKWQMFALLFLVTFVAYWPSTNNHYIWDDDYYIEHNPTLVTNKGFTRLEGLKLIWWPFSEKEVSRMPIHPIEVQYYPVTYSSFWLESFFYGPNEPLGFHVVNILLHVLVAFLLWRALLELQVPWAFGITFIFALHPVHVESVAWVTERKNVLSGVFYFLAMLSYFKSRPLDQEDKKTKKLNRFYFLSLLFFVLAMLSKTVTCTFPAVMLLIYWWKGQPLVSKKNLAFVPFFVLGLILGILTIWMEREQAGAIGEDWNVSLFGRFLLAGRIVCFYISKLIWPSDLSFIYPKWNVSTSEPLQYIYSIIVLCSLFLFWKQREDWGKGPLVALLIFLGTLFPALGFFNVYPFKFSYVADHFQYLASIAMLTIIVSASHRLWNHVVVSRFILIVILIPMFYLTYIQQVQYKNEETLWRATIEKNPKAWLAHNNLGKSLADRGDLEGANSCYRRALELRPGYVMAMNNLAGNHADRYELRRQPQDLEMAKKYVSRAFLKMKSLYEDHLSKGQQRLPEDYIKTLSIRGTIYLLEGNLKEALSNYKRSEALDGNRSEVQSQLGAIYIKLRQYDKALHHLNNAVILNPKIAEVYVNIGNVLRYQNKHKEALPYLRKAVQLEENNPEALYNLATALQREKKVEEAIGYFYRIVQLNSHIELVKRSKRRIMAIQNGIPKQP